MVGRGLAAGVLALPRPHDPGDQDRRSPPGRRAGRAPGAGRAAVLRTAAGAPLRQLVGLWAQRFILSSNKGSFLLKWCRPRIQTL